MPPSLNSLVLTTEAMVMPVGEVYSERAARPLQPFALGPGEWRAVAVRARFQKCGLHSEPGVFQILESETITFRVLGIPQQMEVPLPTRLVVESPPRSACPE